MDLIHNERIKLLATFLNSVGVAVFAVCYPGPIRWNHPWWWSAEFFFTGFGLIIREAGCFRGWNHERDGNSLVAADACFGNRLCPGGPLLRQSPRPEL